MMKELFERYPELEACRDSIAKAAEFMLDTYKRGGKILLCGNGGSCSDCDHIAGELLKCFKRKRKITPETKAKIEQLFPSDTDYFAEKLERGIPAISLPSQTAAISAYVNDVCADMVYAQLTYAYARESDLLIAISTSGNSANVVNAAKMARVCSMNVIGLTGANPCRLDDICDTTIKVPAAETYKIQEYHLPVYHYLCAAIEKKIFG